jgi:hypothetical protein
VLVSCGVGPETTPGFRTDRPRERLEPSLDALLARQKHSARSLQPGSGIFEKDSARPLQPGSGIAGLNPGLGSFTTRVWDRSQVRARAVTSCVSATFRSSRAPGAMKQRARSPHHDDLDIATFVNIELDRAPHPTKEYLD